VNATQQIEVGGHPPWEIVPRGTIWGEWEGFGKLCSKWLCFVELAFA
jgi:hypothetical protein